MKTQPIVSDLDMLVSKLQNSDRKYARMTKSLQWVYWVLIPVYILIAVRVYLDSADIWKLVGGLSIVASFLVFALVMRNLSNAFNDVDYSQPTLTMLKAVIKRYKPFSLKNLWFLPALGLMDFGLIQYEPSAFGTLAGQLIFAAIFGGAIVIGLLVWFVKYKPLLDQARAFIVQIEGE